MVSLSESGRVWFQSSGCVRHQWQFGKRGSSPHKPMCPTGDAFRNQPPWINPVWKKGYCCVLKIWSLQHYSRAAACCPLYFDTKTFILLLHLIELLDSVRRGKEEVSSCVKCNNTIHLIWNRTWTNGLITLFTMICISWVKQCRFQQEWIVERFMRQCCCHQVELWGTGFLN